MFPATNSVAFERQSGLFQVALPEAFVLTERGSDGRAGTGEEDEFAARSLMGGEQTADRCGQFGRAAQVERPLAHAVAVTERVVGTVALAGDDAPGGDDGSLMQEMLGLAGQEAFDGDEFLVNGSHLVSR